MGCAQNCDRSPLAVTVTPWTLGPEFRVRATSKSHSSVTVLARSTKLGMLIELNEYYNFALGDLYLIPRNHRQTSIAVHCSLTSLFVCLFSLYSLLCCFDFHEIWVVGPAYDLVVHLTLWLPWTLNSLSNGRKTFIFGTPYPKSIPKVIFAANAPRFRLKNA